eukprot:scaffold125075_cov18-Tisochrysis_lutea.AAC.1
MEKTYATYKVTAQKHYHPLDLGQGSIIYDCVPPALCSIVCCKVGGAPQGVVLSQTLGLPGSQTQESSQAYPLNKGQQNTCTHTHAAHPHPLQPHQLPPLRGKAAPAGAGAEMQLHSWRTPQQPRPHRATLRRGRTGQQRCCERRAEIRVRALVAETGKKVRSLVLVGRPFAGGAQVRGAAKHAEQASKLRSTEQGAHRSGEMLVTWEKEGSGCNRTFGTHHHISLIP